MAGNARRAGGRIVVGVDGTATSAAAVRWAIHEARLRQASLHLVSADDSRHDARAPYAGGPGPPRPDAGNPLETALHAAEQQATQTLPAPRLSSELADGPPARVLIDRSAGAELLVLGGAYQEGQSAIQAPPVIGPVARACLHQAACPVVFVLAVRPRENSLAPLIFHSGGYGHVTAPWRTVSTRRPPGRIVHMG